MTFNYPRLLELAKLCKLSYKEKEKPCYHQNGVYCFFDEETHTLVIRGTDTFGFNIFGWLRNLFAFDNWPDDSFHDGWCLAADKIFVWLWGNGYRPLTVTGHSAGGAVGGILVQKYLNDTELVTFACPGYIRSNEVGYQRRVAHVYTKYDFIRRMPPPKLGYDVVKGKTLALHTPRPKMFKKLAAIRNHSIDTYMKCLKKLNRKGVGRVCRY